MPKQNKTLRKYLRQVKRSLPCSKGLKRRIVSDLYNNISLYLDAHPEADEEYLFTVFGTPEQITQTYLDELPTTELINKFHHRRKLFLTVASIIGVCALVSILIWGSAVIAALHSVQQRSNPIYETIIEEE